MAFKFIAFATLVAAASAGILQPAPLAYHSAHQVAPLTWSQPAAPIAYAAAVPLAKSYEHDYADSHPQYSYSYGVHDTLTGDAKTQEETRDGDVVKGSYSLIEADGSRRVVHYTADDHNGFNAIVEKQPAKIETVAPVHLKTVQIAQPAKIAYQHVTPVVKIAAPIAYKQAPLIKIAQPVTYQQATPVVKIVKKIAYEQAPLVKIAQPVTYQQAPLIKIAAPLEHSSYAASSYSHGYETPALENSYYH